MHGETLKKNVAYYLRITMGVARKKHNGWLCNSNKEYKKCTVNNSLKKLGREISSKI